MEFEYKNKLASLIERLYDKTRNNTINWKESAAIPDSNAYETELGKFTVTISDYGQDVLIRVTDKNGRLVENITDPMLSEISVPSFLHSGWYAYMKDLLKMIERRVNGSENAIDEIIDLLGNNED